ncbi:hypothetical protein FF36_06355 [Frankia torreyi]|uniref:Uncharacterized protein n=1 Tax=Frankia torreyi TaxID=1856 RepID=A0A0D8B7L4_9ACTN|nr:MULTISPECIES: hypothetical protein [Frankia]KJE19367.1 hypothetical protein FF36_06355 [Frankia torreyi]KQM01831.1 hypothetical protein FF86_11038 [Frankia sp. CpI1-P]
MVASALEVLAETLENLGWRISKDLNLEATESAPLDLESWQEAAASLVAYAETCMEVLEQPEVAAALANSAPQAAPDPAARC